MTPKEFLAEVKRAKAFSNPAGEPEPEFLRIHAEQQRAVGAERVNPEKFFDDYLTQMFDLILSVLPPIRRAELKTRVAVGALDNAVMNAFITRDPSGENFAILLNRALLTMINHYVKLVASANYPDAVVYCGGKDVAGLSRANYLSLMNELLIRYAKTGKPRGPELKLALNSDAMSFVDAALKSLRLFVLAHEVGHYVNGDLTDEANFARSDEIPGASVFVQNLSHKKEYRADERAFDIALRVLREVEPDYRARRALDLSAMLFFNLVRDISNRGSPTHPRSSDRLLHITRAFFGEAAAVTLERSFSDLSQIQKFREQVDHLTVSEALRNRGDMDE